MTTELNKIHRHDNDMKHKSWYLWSTLQTQDNKGKANKQICLVNLIFKVMKKRKCLHLAKSFIQKHPQRNEEKKKRVMTAE